MSPEELIAIKVSVADRILRLKVPRKNEEHVRLAARLLNHRMEEFRKMGGSENIDMLAMAALDYTTDLAKSLNEKNDSEEAVMNELSGIEALLRTASS